MNKLFTKISRLFLAGVVLVAVGCTDYDDDIQKIDKIIGTDNWTAPSLVEQIDALKKADTDLTAQIDAAKKYAEETYATKAELAAAQKSLSDALEAYKTKTDGSISALQTAVDNLDELTKKHTTQLKNLEDYVATAKEAIEDLQKGVSDNAKAIEALDTKVTGQIAALDKRVEDAETSIKKINEELLPAIDKQIKDLQDLKADKADLDAYKEETNETIGLMQDAIDELDDKVAALDEKFELYVTKENHEKDLAALKADLEAQIKVNADNIDALKKDLKEVKDLAEANKTAISTLEDETKEAINSITEEGGVIDQRIAAALVTVNNDIKTIADKVDALDTRLSKAEVDIDKLLSRIQSIVYVPDYSDGKITVNYATVGGEIVEGQTTAKYRVRPAEAAEKLATAFAQDATVLSYLHEDLKTRAAEHEFNIVKVAVNEKESDVLDITFQTRGLEEEFYKGSKEYAIALVAAHGESATQYTTVYTNVVPVSAPEELSLVVIEDPSLDVTLRKELAEENEYAYELPFNDLETVICVLEKHQVGIKVGDELLTVAEAKAKGYEIPEITVEEPAYADAPKDEDCVYGKLSEEEQAAAAANVLSQPNEEGIVEVSMKEEEPNAVGLVRTVTYAYTLGDATVKVSAPVEITPITSELTLPELTIVWTYELDAESDSLQAPYVRENLKLDESAFVRSEEWPIDLTYETLFAQAADQITVNDKLLAADGKPVIAYAYDAEGKTSVLNISDFEWKQKYVVVYTIDLGYTVVKVSQTINTVPRPEKLLVELDDASVKVQANLEVKGLDPRVNGQVNDLAVVYDMMSEFTGLEASDYIAEIFHNHKYEYVSTVFTSGEEQILASKVDGWVSDLHVAEDKAPQMVWLGYSYLTEGGKGNLVGYPEITYTKTVKTWFGQEVVFVQKLKFIMPDYKFVRDEFLVNNPNTDVYYSLANGKYSPSAESHAIDTFEVAHLDLDEAFHVAFGNETLLKRNGQYEEHNLSTEFKLVEPEKIKSAGIKFGEPNFLAYEGVDESVKVTGQLFINNDNDTKWEVPGAFSLYEDKYTVHKFDPVGDLKVVKNPEVTLIDAKVYKINMLECFSLDENRHIITDTEGKYNHALITDAAWTVGNGENGFANGLNADTFYGLTYEFAETGVNDVMSSRVHVDNKGLLTIDNVHQLATHKDVTFNVTLKIGYTYGPEATYDAETGLGYKQATVQVTIKKNVE